MSEHTKGVNHEAEDLPGAGGMYAQELWEEAEGENEQQPEPRTELLCFRAGEEEFALNVFEIREIIKYHPVTVVPRCPAYILGVISLRGEIIPVINLKKRLELGGESGGGEPMMVIVHNGEEGAGILVEGIRGILSVKESEIELAPEVISPEKAEYFKGVIRSGERLATILNLKHLLDISGEIAAGSKEAGER